MTDDRKDKNSRLAYEVDIDRYVNEGLHGGYVNRRTGGLIEEDIPLKKQDKGD